jgi:hypothetical protein
MERAVVHGSVIPKDVSVAVNALHVVRLLLASRLASHFSYSEKSDGVGFAASLRAFARATAFCQQSELSRR